jgi:aminopeptidase N
VALETQTRPIFGTDTVGIPVVVEHELAHQWGGNDVTPATWEHLWLSEGFATYASGDVTPPFGGTRHPVVSPEAARALDDTVYNGGGTALLALGDEVGQERLDRILRTWFERYGGGTATTEDFVALASEIAGVDLAEWATTWLYEPQPTYVEG